MVPTHRTDGFRHSGRAVSPHRNIQKSFVEDIDKWNKKNPNLIYKVGTASEIYRIIGILNKKNIYIDSKKLVKIMDKHPEMTMPVIKKIPYAINKPISILKSKTKPGRLVIISDVFPQTKGTNQIPMIVVLELNPIDKNGVKLDELRVASAYGKDSITQNWLNYTCVYITDNKKKIRKWEAFTGHKLPTKQNLSTFKKKKTCLDKKAV